MGEWTTGGERVTFESNELGFYNVFWKSAGVAGTEERLTTSQNTQDQTRWSPDGANLIFTEHDPVTGMDIWTFSLKERKAQPFVRTPYNEANVAFSPDGHWIAYQSDESGRNEVYVQPFPGLGSKGLVSTEGGTEPVWSHDGRELFYRNGDKMMSIATVIQPTFHASKPEVLFEKPYWYNPYYAAYDVSPDGSRFLMLKESEQVATATVINVVLNWFSELKQRVPVK